MWSRFFLSNVFFEFKPYTMFKSSYSPKTCRTIILIVFYLLFLPTFHVEDRFIYFSLDLVSWWNFVCEVFGEEWDLLVDVFLYSWNSIEEVKSEDSCCYSEWSYHWRAVRWSAFVLHLCIKIQLFHLSIRTFFESRQCCMLQPWHELVGCWYD